MVNTYVDPKTNIPYDFGVQAFVDLPLGVGNQTASSFFERFGVATAPAGFSTDQTLYYDFTTGKPVNFTAPTQAEAGAALEKLISVIDPWTPYFEPGFWNFPLPADIPEDLLIPWGEFVTKYGLEAAVPGIYESTGLGLGNITLATTLFELEAFNINMAKALLGEWPLIHPAAGGNQALYTAIGDDLGDDVLYNSTVVSSVRTDRGVTLTVVNHVNGKVTKINAKQLLISIEPTASNTASLDLDANEKNVLGKFTYSTEFTALINNPALEAGITYSNLPAGAAPNNYQVLPNSSFTNTIAHVGGDNLFHVIIIGEENLDEAGAKAVVQESFDKLLSAGALNSTTPQKVNFVDFSVHGAMHARVTPEEVKAGFYQDLYALQGQRSTWWTGGAFKGQYQTELWAFDETLIPKILAELN
jgi:hypothetical protein